MLEWGEKEKGERLEVELDLGGGYCRGNMLAPSLENAKEAHFGSFGQF